MVYCIPIKIIQPFLQSNWFFFFLFFQSVKVTESLKLAPVNNAGSINKNNKIWEVPAEEFSAVIDTNVKGTANILRHFLPPMIENKRGIIVNLSSGWGRSAAAEVTIVLNIYLQ